MTILNLTLTHESDRGFFCEEHPNATGTTVDNTVAAAILAAMVSDLEMNTPSLVKIGGYKRSEVQTNRVKYLLQQRHTVMTGNPMEVDFEVKIND